MSNSEQIVHSVQTTNLADILERVLDKGIVIAGDIQIKLADVELLTIKIRLLIASVDKAQQIGINWWETDSYLSSNVKKNAPEKENERLEKTTDSLKSRLRRSSPKTAKLEKKTAKSKSPRKRKGVRSTQEEKQEKVIIKGGAK